MEPVKSAMNRSVGSEIKAMRARRGLLQSELAAKTGISLTQLIRLETNKRDINVTQLFAIAQALDVRPEDIVRSAIDSNGGMEALVSEVHGNNENDLDRARAKRGMTQEEADALTTGDIEMADLKAAYRDPEADTDEPLDT